MNLQEYLIKNFDVDIGDGIPVPLTTYDGGPGWTSLVRYQECDDASAGIAITPVPSAGTKIVVDDVILSVKTAQDVFIKSPVGGNVAKFFLGDTATAQMTPRGKISLPAGDRLVAKSDISGKLAVTALYHEEPTDDPAPVEGFYSLTFDGVDDMVSLGTAAKIAEASVGDDFTLDVCFRPIDDDLGGGALFAYGESDTYLEVWVSFNAGNLVADTYVGGVSSVTNLAVPFTSDWHYIRIRRAAGYLFMYLDGVEGVYAFEDTGRDAPTGNCNLGAWVRTGYEPDVLLGKICYLQAWSADMGALETIPSTPFESDDNTVARLIFGEGVGDMLFDSSDNNMNGTIVGAAWDTDFPWSEAE